MLIVLSGLPGTGKSTLAQRLSENLDAQILRTDVIRRELIGKSKYFEFKERDKLYTKEEMELAYYGMFLVASHLLKASKNVILDATFYKKSLRDRAREVGKTTNSKTYILEVICPEKVVEERMRKRFKDKRNASTASFEIYERMKGIFEPPEEKHFKIDTSLNLQNQIESFLEKIQITYEKLKDYQKMLLDAAEKALKNSYSPYSKFSVAAALLTKSGRIITGSNFENVAFGSTVCAEVCAVTKANSLSERSFRAIAIIADSQDPISPCGNCRQVLYEVSELSGRDIEVIMSNLKKEKIIISSVRKLLPSAFKALK
ncbi:MAG: cytidine deaminase [Candidatus Methanofastidiosia archaeon]